METTTQSEAGAVAQGAVAELRFSTDGINTPFDAWRACLSVLLDADKSQTFPTDDFAASLIVQHLGTFLLCRSFADKGRLRRTDVRIGLDDIDHVVISCLLSGGIAVGGAARRLRPGDLTVVDLSTPMVFAMAAANALHVIVPRMALPVAVASATPMPCRILRRGTAMGIFMRGLIDGLFAASSYFNTAEVGTLSSYFPELLGGLLGTSSVARSAMVAKGDLGRRLRRHIEDNLNRTDLTASRLAREAGVSRSQLYRQFETTGGVDRYIRRRRLRRSLQALTDPRSADLRIADIAYDVGFSDEAHFSRLFRQAYGQSPRDTRAAARDGPSRAKIGTALSPEAGTSFAEWLLTLGLQ